MAGLVSNNWSNYLLLSLQLARISTVFFSVPALKYFILWMQVLFSSQSAHRHCLSGYPVVRFGTQNNVVVFFFFRVSKNAFRGSSPKITIHITVTSANHIHLGNTADYPVEEQRAHIIPEICRLETRTDKNQEDYH